MRQQFRQAGVLIALATAVYLIGLGATQLWDDDETFYAQTAREMFERGDYIVPWFNHALFAHKPPFMFWMMIGAYHVFGVTEFAARLPSVFFGVANVLLLWRLGRILYSPRAGFWAAIALATSLNYIVVARAAACDAELIFFTMLPIYLLVRSTATRRQHPREDESALTWQAEGARRIPSWRTLALVYASMGAAVMVKGPIGVALPTCVLVLFRLSLVTLPPGSIGGWRGGLSFLAAAFAPRHVLRTIWQLRPLTALAAVLLVAGPWFAAVSYQTRGEFLEGFLGIHHLHRFTNTMDNHGGPAYFYLIAVCIGFFPWCIFLSPTCIDLVARLKEVDRRRPADALCLAWIAVWIGFFSLATTKFPHYILPAYPALALLTACFLDRWLGEFEIYGTITRRAAWVTVALSGVAVAVIVPFVAREFLPTESRLWLLGAPLVLGAGVCTWLCERRRQIALALGSLAVTTGVFAVSLLAGAGVVVDRYQNTAPLADAIRQHDATPEVRIATLQYFRPGLVYYSNRQVTAFLDARLAVEFVNAAPARSYLVTTETEYQQIAAELPTDFTILDRTPWFLRTGKTLVLVGPAPEGPTAPPVQMTRADGQ